MEGSPQAGKGGEGFKLMLTEFYKAFPDWRDWLSGDDKTIISKKSNIDNEKKW